MTFIIHIKCSFYENHHLCCNASDIPKWFKDLFIRLETAYVRSGIVCVHVRNVISINSYTGLSCVIGIVLQRVR